MIISGTTTLPPARIVQPFQLPRPAIRSSRNQRLDRGTIQELHTTYGITIPQQVLPLQVIPPKGISKSLTNRFLYCIKDCSIMMWGQKLKFDFYFAKELLTQEDKLLHQYSSDIIRKLDTEKQISNETPAEHLKTHLERIIEHALNYEHTDEQIKAINAIFDTAQNGKKMIFLSAHGVSSEDGWGLDLHNVPHLLPVNKILSELSSNHSDNHTELIYINSCNRDNLPIEFGNRETPITLPVIAHTDVNGPSYCPAKLYLAA